MKDDTLASLKGFLDGFGVEVPRDVMVRGRRAYLVPERVRRLAGEVKLEAFSLGLPLGESTPRGFAPSFALLDLCKGSRNRVVVKDEVEWLFTCGRDVFLDKVVEQEGARGTFLVCNRRGQVLGLGSFAQKGKNRFVRNVLDRGDFLRREERRKKR